MKTNGMKRIVALSIILVFACSMLTGCTKTTANTVPTSSARIDINSVSKENPMKIISELTSEKYMGRLAGTVGGSQASEYIAGYFREIGLESPSELENYMQHYQMPLIELTERPVLQILDGNGKVQADFKYAEDFVLRRVSSETDHLLIEAPMYLIKDSAEMIEKKDKFKDKVLLIPWKYYGMLGQQNQPADFAKTCGALGVISEFDLEKNDLGYRYLKSRPLFGGWMTRSSYKPFAFADSDTFSKLVEAANKGEKLHFACSSQISISDKAANVVGVIPGSDPKLKDEYIIIGAHFDHVGYNLNGTYNPGALDNASGAAAMLELARVIRESKLQPKKSILFIAFDGEESGLFGSSHYCEVPVYPLKKSVMINLDMVGSAAEMPLSIALSSDGSDASLQEVLVSYADKLSIAYKKDVDDGSDHTPFALKGVPSVCLINLDLGHGYHSPQDTIDKVDGDRLKEVVRLVLYYINENAF